MTDLEMLLNRVRKLQSETFHDVKTNKDKWKEDGFQSALEYIEQEIKNIMEDNQKKGE